MSKSNIHIDFSKSKREDDLIKIKLRNEDVVEVNFSKLVGQSKYMRDKYRYSEAIELIQQEIEEVEEKMRIKDESVKLFIELIQEEKVEFPIENYKDIYTLSEYFCTPTITNELDNISDEWLFKDLNFTIQFLKDNQTINNGFDTKLTIKIENFLKEHINECISNAKFGELAISTIFRLINESKEKVDFNLLVDFILESAITRFIMFKLVEIDKLSEDKFYELIKFFESQEETTQQMYLEYIPLNLSLIKNMMNKYDQAMKELNQTKQELSECKKEIKQIKDAFNQIKSEKKPYTQSILFGGCDCYNVLGEKSNNESFVRPIISSPVKLYSYPSSLLSYSAYLYHSVLVTSDGSLKGVGYNEDGRISSTLPKTDIEDFTDFCIKDGSGRQLAAVSAVCSAGCTLYMFSKSSGNERQLVLCDNSINGGDPVFLDIGNHHPVSLFGGYSHSAAIGSEGEVIFINHFSVKKSPNSPIASVSLPDGEKASSVACCNKSVVVLSSNGRVFTSKIESNRVLNFSIVSELSGQEIVCVSGTEEHFLAVNKEGRVFGRGSNGHGKLGLGEETESVSSFTEISSLSKYEIRAAYAGSNHSLFETREGKILSCGFSISDQLLLSSKPDKKDVYSPTETTITNGASFCIAGYDISAVYIGNDPPPNTPNKQIKFFK